MACPYFGSCGGCSIQHLDYAQQLQLKKEQVMKLLNIPDIAVFSSQPFSYRNRVEFLFHPKGLGLRKKDHSLEIIDVEECPIAVPLLNQLLQEVRGHFPLVDSFNLRSKKGLYRYAVIRATASGDTSISFVLNEDATEKGQAILTIKSFAAKTSAKNILVTFVPSALDEAYSSQYLIVKGKDYLQESLCRKTFLFPIQGFFQNNSEMAKKMIGHVRKILQKYSTTDAELLDLYSGVGSFGVVCSDLFKKVTFIEQIPEAVAFAKRNITENRLNNASAHALQAHQLSRLKFSEKTYIIADPPRIGMEQKAIVQLNTIKPKVIVYVSCNPLQLSKDLAKFKRYEIKSVALFDLFPQTWHSEVVVEIVRKEE